MSVSVEQIRQHLDNNPAAMPSQVAVELNISEFAVVSALPKDQLTILPLAQKDALLTELPEWG
ncbi:heme utilization cystosolic carrier protein HutX, partial [Shewanella sp. 0m-11]